MKREYTSGVDEGVEYFVGVEIEHIPSYGLKTLFVATPTIDLNQISSLVDKHRVDAVYFGANHVYRAKENVVDNVNIFQFASDNPEKKVIIDIPPGKWNDYQCGWKVVPSNIIFMVSCEVRYANKNNVFVKIDDSGFRGTNPGVWVIDPRSETVKFNDWEKYGNDTIIGA